jgi:hypothetical protein|tara:strand:- start:842 stop:1024 length:183 start_codon:yes stop_codon:yes gene_type:complete
MRKFDHWKILKIAFDIIYVASFIALLAFTISSAKESQDVFDGDKNIEKEQLDCMNCDEID